MSGAPKFDGFEVWMEVSPSFYLMRSDPARNFGVGNVKMTFYARGDKGAIQWMIGTDWGIAQVREHLAGFGFSKYDDPRKPSGWDLGYHAHEAQYEGQSAMSETCSVLGGPCYYDGSSLNGDLPVEGFLAGGTDWLWPKLIEVYRSYFEGAEWPDFTPTYRQHPDDIKAAEAAP